MMKFIRALRRDFFAVMSLGAMWPYHHKPEEIARRAYQIADAMLKEREK